MAKTASVRAEDEKGEPVRRLSLASEIQKGNHIETDKRKEGENGGEKVANM